MLKSAICLSVGLDRDWEHMLYMRRRFVQHVSQCLRVVDAARQRHPELQRRHMLDVQSSLPKLDYSPLAAREHLTALELSDQLQRNLRQEQGLQLELSTTFFSQVRPPAYGAMC